MASEWIKIRCGIFGDPAVISIASSLNMAIDEVVGKLIRFWTWADEHLVDGDAPSVTSSWVDELTRTPGFAAAMAHAGWLAEKDGGIVIPHFERHLGQSAKRRALTAKRMLEQREKSDDPVTLEASRERHQMKIEMKIENPSSTSTTRPAAAMPASDAASVTKEISTTDAPTEAPSPSSKLTEARRERHELVDAIARHLSLGYAKAARVVDEIGVSAEDWKAWLAYEAEHGTPLTVLNIQRFRHPRQVPKPVVVPTRSASRNGGGSGDSHGISRRSSFAKPGKFERDGGER